MINKDDIIGMAREAGFCWPNIQTMTIEQRLERFATLVAAAEREACAQVCESLASPSRLSDPSRSWITGTLDCATAIRARSQE